MARVSPYYSWLLKFVAILALVVLGVVLVGGALNVITYLTRGYTYNGTNPVLDILYGLVNVIMIFGGFGIGWLASRNTRLSKRERIVLGTSAGLLANIIYIPLTGVLSVALYRFVGGIATPLLYLHFLFPLIIVGLFVLIARRVSSSWPRTLRAGFVTVFWLGQVWALVQTLIIASRSTVQNGNVWITSAIIIVLPLALLAIFYAPLKPIGRLTRIFFGTFFIALVSAFALAVSKLAWSNNYAFTTNFQTFILIITVALITFIESRLIIARRIRSTATSVV